MEIRGGGENGAANGVVGDGAAAGARDVVRQVAVAVSAVVAVVVSTLGSGAFGGTPVAEAAGGALSASATLVAPAGPAFSLWGVIYAGLLAYAVWQLLPAHRADARQRATGWWAVPPLLLNAVWVLVVQADQVALSVLVLAALVATLAVVVGRSSGSQARSRVEGVVVDGALGLYLGWAVIATVANTAAALVQAGAGGPGGPGSPAAQTWAAGVLAAAAVLGVWLSLATGHLAPALGLGWGLAWVAVGRADDGPDASGAVALAAGLAAAVVAVSGVVGRLRRHRRDGARSA